MAASSCGVAGPVAETTQRPAFYAARPGGWRDWWTLVHPPYTVWHLSYVCLGAALAPKLDGGRLVATLGAFFAAVGVAAHALDERHDRPLGTHMSNWALDVAAGAGVGVAIALGVIGTLELGWVLLPLIAAGTVLVFGYNLELFGGRLHSDRWFAVAWGAFPVITAYVAQTGTLAVAPVVAAGGAFALSTAQRALSTPARALRRTVATVDGAIVRPDGRATPLDRATLLSPLETALRSMSWAIATIAVALVIARRS